MTIGVEDAPSFEECDRVLIEHLRERGVEGKELSNAIKRVIKWNGKK